MERSRVIFGLVLGTLLTISLTSYAQQNVFVLANPIWDSPLSMRLENINTTICLVDQGLLAKVNATYYFVSIVPYVLKIDYPLPPDAQKVSVALDNNSLAELQVPWLKPGPPQALQWTYNSKIYSTALGDWPMINFTINSPTWYYGKRWWFGLSVYYEHFLPLSEGSYTYLYALGSSRYMQITEYYYRIRWAYVTINMQMNYTNLDVHSVGYSNGLWTWTPANYTLVQETKTDTVDFDMHGYEEVFTKDFALTFSNPMAFSPFDLTGDLKVDIRDLAIEAQAFGSYSGCSNWRATGDFNSDGNIDIRDLVLVAKNFGKTYGQREPEPPSQFYLTMKTANMTPTININDTLIVRNTTDGDLVHAGGFGDIIVFKNPINLSDLIVHRAEYKTMIDNTWYFKTMGDADFNYYDWVGSDTYQGMISENLLIGKVIHIIHSST